MELDLYQAESLAEQIQLHLLNKYVPPGFVCRKDSEVLWTQGLEPFLKRPFQPGLQAAELLPHEWLGPLALGMAALLEAEQSSYLSELAESRGALRLEYLTAQWISVQLVNSAEPGLIAGHGPHSTLEHSQAQLQAIFTSSHESLLLLDTELLIQAYNPGFVKWTENAELPQPAIGKSILEILPAESHALFQEQMQSVLSQGKTIEVENVFNNSKGESFWYIVARSPVRDAENRITGICVSARDISARKQAEAQLAEYAERLSLILESITDAFVTLDAEGRFTYANQTAIRLLQMDPDKLVGHSLWAMFPSTEAPLFADRYRWALIYQEPVHFEVHHQKLAAWLEVSIYPTEENFSVFFRDITEIKFNRHIISLEREILARYTTGQESSQFLLSEILKQLQLMLPGTACLIQVPDQDSQQLQLLNSSSLPARIQQIFGQQSLAAGQVFATEAVLQKRPIFLTDLNKPLRWTQAAQLLDAGFQAAWAYPVLSTEQEVLAVLSCFFVNPHSPRLPETLLFEQVCQLLATLLEHQVV